ncbi:MAG: CPBP family intramembrane metalloprotease [Actinobacteria bacterium]|nr:MAG: CPBP family intramembrane metalloprotease [Actinomycetota bacterium]
MVFAGAGLFAVWIYLRTGSLLLPIVLHVVMDLRALVPARQAVTAPGRRKSLVNDRAKRRR